MGYLAGRLVQGLLVITTVLVVVFFAVRFIGDPVNVILPIDASEAARENLRHQLGLDRPVLSQFGSFLNDALRLEFGDSYARRTPTLPIVLDRFPTTLKLVLVSMGMAVAIGMLVGTLAALRPKGLFDRLCVLLSLISASVPQFWLGLILILFFSVRLGMFPSSGTGSLDHIVLPATTLALPPAGRFAVVVRSVLRDELSQDYVRMDQARGFPKRRIVRHAFRSIAVTILSIVGYELIYTLAGHSVVVETVFAWPGIGSLVTESLNGQDLALIQAVVVFIAVLVVVLNLLFDLVYLWIDPRIAAGSRDRASGASQA